MTIIPTFQQESPQWVQEVSLGGSIFSLRFRWNTRQQSWFMDVRKEDRTPILSGLRLIPGTLLLDRHKWKPELPDGDLVLIDQKNNPAEGELSYDNLGRRYILTYLSEEELP